MSLPIISASVLTFQRKNRSVARMLSSIQNKVNLLQWKIDFDLCSKVVQVNMSQIAVFLNCNLDKVLKNL